MSAPSPKTLCCNVASCLVLLLLAGHVSLASAAPPRMASRVPHQLVVRYAPGATAAQRAAARASIGARLGRRLALPQAELLLLPSRISVPQAARALGKRPAVRY